MGLKQSWCCVGQCASLIEGYEQFGSACQYDGSLWQHRDALRAPHKHRHKSVKVHRQWTKLHSRTAQVQVHAIGWSSYVQVGGPDSSSSSTLTCSCSSRNCFTRAKLTSLLILGQQPGLHTLLSSYLQGWAQLLLLSPLGCASRGMCGLATWTPCHQGKG